MVTLILKLTLLVHSYMNLVLEQLGFLCVALLLIGSNYHYNEAWNFKNDSHLAFLFAGIDGQDTLKGPIEEVAKVEAEEAEDLLRQLGIPVCLSLSTVSCFMVKCEIQVKVMIFSWYITLYIPIQWNRKWYTCSCGLFAELLLPILASTFSIIANLCLVQSPFSSRHSPRGIFCSRTLNLRSISAIGYDMDYTLMHYNVMVISKYFYHQF